MDLIERLRNPVGMHTARNDALNHEAADEIERLRYWLLKLDRDDIVNDAVKFSGPEEERRKDAHQQLRSDR